MAHNLNKIQVLVLGLSYVSCQAQKLGINDQQAKANELELYMNGQQAQVNELAARALKHIADFGYTQDPTDPAVANIVSQFRANEHAAIDHMLAGHTHDPADPVTAVIVSRFRANAHTAVRLIANHMHTHDPTDPAVAHIFSQFWTNAHTAVSHIIAGHTHDPANSAVAHIVSKLRTITDQDLMAYIVTKLVRIRNFSISLTPIFRFITDHSSTNPGSPYINPVSPDIIVLKFVYGYDHTNPVITAAAPFAVMYDHRAPTTSRAEEFSTESSILNKFINEYLNKNLVGSDTPNASHTSGCYAATEAFEQACIKMLNGPYRHILSAADRYNTSAEDESTTDEDESVDEYHPDTSNESNAAEEARLKEQAETQRPVIENLIRQEMNKMEQQIESDNKEQCTICLNGKEQEEQNGQFGLIRCKHYFHLQCLANNLIARYSNKYEINCSECRADCSYLTTCLTPIDQE